MLSWRTGEKGPLPAAAAAAAAETAFASADSGEWPLVWGGMPG